MGSFCNCTREPSVINNNRSTNRNKRSNMILKGIGKFQDFKEDYEFVSMIGNETSLTKVRIYRNKKIKDAKFAIKTLKKDNFHVEYQICILDEVLTLKGLDHPNIVKYFMAYEEENFIHIVMEYIPGFNLYEVLKQRKIKNKNLNEKDLFNIINNIIKPINFLHSLNIPHKELKPENILFYSIDDLSNLKLIDFGFSIVETLSDNIFGSSPNFLGYEIVNGKVNKGSDIWSIGAILFYLITGDLPFKGKSRKDIIKNIRNGLTQEELQKLSFFLSENNLTEKNKKKEVNSEQEYSNKYKSRSNKKLIELNISDKISGYKHTISIDSTSNVVGGLNFNKNKFDFRDKNKSNKISLDFLKDLVLRCLEKDEKKRINCDEILNHPWINLFISKRFFLIFL